MRRIHRISVLLFVVIVLAIRPGALRAEETLSCVSVSVIVPADIGSGSDLIARAFAEAASDLGEVTYRVRNRPREIAHRILDEAAPDGCTLLLDTQVRVAFEMMQEDLSEWDDYKPVALLTRTPIALALSGASRGGGRGDEPVRFRSLVSDLLKEPESVTFGLVDDPLERMLFLQLEDELGVRFRIRSYGDGIARYRDLLAGRDRMVGFTSLFAARAHVKDKAFDVLALSDTAPSGFLEGVPLISSEAKGHVFGIDHGLFAPLGTSDSIVAMHSEIAEKVMDKRGVLAALHNENGTDVFLLKGDGFARYLENMAADWTEMLQRKDNSGRLGRKS